jgi:hypothetical protein
MVDVRPIVAPEHAGQDGGRALQCGVDINDAGTMLSHMPASTQLTLRDVKPRLRAALAREAKRRGLSLNRAVLALLSEATGLARADRAAMVEHDDLDALAGSWSDEDADAFDAALAAQRQIDPKLW